MELTVKAATLPELFEKVVQELTRVLRPGEPPSETLREKLVVEGPDLTAVLRAWAETLLTLYTTQRQLFARARTLSLEPSGGIYRLHAEAWGELVDPVVTPPISVQSVALVTPEPGFPWSAHLTLDPPHAQRSGYPS